MKRTLLLGTAWTASAAAAVGLGFLAVSLVGASASSGTLPVAVTGSLTSSPDDTARAATPTPTSASGQQSTVGGTVYASCSGTTPTLAGAPAAGWWIDDSADPGQVEFKDGDQKVEVLVACVDGSPRFSVQGPRADDSGAGRTPATSQATPRATPSPADDSAGRTGGGHGADDPAGDDSSGRGGGGHGADDPAGDDSSGRGGGGHGSDG